MDDEITLYDSERTFRRVLTFLLFFYLIGVVLIQVKGESLRLLVPAPSPQEPPRMAKILTAPPKISLPQPVEIKTGPPSLPAPSVAKLQPVMPPPTTLEQAPKGKKSETPPPSASSQGQAKRPSREEIKKVGLLGLLGEGKNSTPSLGKKFSSLKETPRLSAQEEADPFPQERIETIRQRTVGAEENKLALTRREAVGENLSETKIFHDGFEFNRDAVSDVVRQNNEGLLALYNRRLQKNPNMQGRLTVEFIISSEGQVLKCRILSSSLSDPLFENEVVREILKWKFPSVEKGTTTVLYPLSFFPAG
jgi:TonB family protein